MNQQFMAPLFLGKPAPGLRELFGDAWVEFPPEDYELIRQPLDFLGVNYYTRNVVRNDPAHWPTCAGRVRVPDALHTATQSEVHPESLTRGLSWVREPYT